jgi:CubicO group peptidase (beta-lactamase class C family)
VGDVVEAGTRQQEQRRRRGRRTVGAAVVALTLVAACAGGSDDDDAADEPAVGEATIGAAGEATSRDTAIDVAGEWTVAEPEDHGIDPSGFEEARGYAFQDDRHTQGVVVVHEGEIVGEWYAEGADASSWTASWSVAKSFASATVGVAIDQGAIPGVDEPMTTWFPEWEGTDKAGITLRDVLQMSTGLDWDEEYDPANAGASEVAAMVATQADQLAYAAGIPAEVEPGTRWSYSSGDTMLLSGVVQQATGEPLGQLAAERIFEPIGMEQVEWWQDAAGHTLTYCCLDSTSRDLARFGWLYLQGGRWGDDQVVPEDWVADSLEPAETSLADDAAPYGYQWWLDLGEGVPEDGFAALGHDGQFVYVIPSLDLVVVRNGTYVKDAGPPIADPNLFTHYPPSGLVEGRGTVPPESWDDAAFLGPIVEAVEAAR